MKKDLNKKILVFVSYVIPFACLFYILYIKTNMGYSYSYNGYTPMYAPLWFESIVGVFLLPMIISGTIYEKLFMNNN